MCYKKNVHKNVKGTTHQKPQHLSCLAGKDQTKMKEMQEAQKIQIIVVSREGQAGQSQTKRMTASGGQGLTPRGGTRLRKEGVKTIGRPEGFETEIPRLA